MGHQVTIVVMIYLWDQLVAYYTTTRMFLMLIWQCSELQRFYFCGCKMDVGINIFISLAKAELVGKTVSVVAIKLFIIIYTVICPHRMDQMKCLTSYITVTNSHMVFIFCRHSFLQFWSSLIFSWFILFLVIVAFHHKTQVFFFSFFYDH